MIFTKYISLAEKLNSSILHVFFFPKTLFRCKTLSQGQKIVLFGRFFGEKSVFGWVGNDFRKEKSEVKKSEK